jgi:hypothetical protein
LKGSNLENLWRSVNLDGSWALLPSVSRLGCDTDKVVALDTKCTMYEDDLSQETAVNHYYKAQEL